MKGEMPGLRFSTVHIVGLLTGIVAATASVAGTGAALATAPGGPERSIAISAARLPLVRTIDPRFQSFQIGFSHLTSIAFIAMPRAGNAACR
ncbi:MAG: hypothetical protein JF593_06440 [Novosphingobium sp.]|nr:hypothetical protein [Novosphingobium sp.]